MEQEDIDTAWIISIVRGILISLFIVCASPLISSFFHAEEALPLLFLSGLVPFVRGFVNPAIARFQKELQFEKEFIIKFSVFLVDSFIAIALVLITRSVAGLVWGLVAGAFFEVILSFSLVHPVPKLSFKQKSFRKIISQGKWIAPLGIFNYLFSQGGNIVVGRFLNSSSLGLYQMAYRISILPITEVADVISRVTFPVYVKIADDLERIKKAFWKTTFGIFLLVVPIGLIFLFFAEGIVRVVLGASWLEVIPVLKILSIFGIIKAIISPSLTVLLSLGKQKQVTAMSFLTLIFLSITIFSFTLKIGIEGTAYSVLIASVLELPIVAFFLVKAFRQDQR